MGETAALDRVLEQARAVRVSLVTGGGEVRVELADPGEAARLRAALAVESLPGFVCACLGDVGFEFFDRDGGRLTSVVLHHGATLRWGQWDGDAVLADGRALLDWLAGHGMPGPLREFEEDRRRAEARQEEGNAWVAAAPAGLKDLVDRILEASAAGGSPSAELLGELGERLRRGFTDPVERTLAVLAWFGSGSGRCSGFPTYEGVPGLLLGEVPIGELIAALEDPRADDRHDAGAVRHLVGWKSRPRQNEDVAALPDRLRERLLAGARGSDDADKRSRAEGWLAPAKDRERRGGSRWWRRGR